MITLCGKDIYKFRISEKEKKMFSQNCMVQIEMFTSRVRKLNTDFLR